MTVHLTSGQIRKIADAHHVRTDEGELWLLDKDEALLAVFSKGSWLFVEGVVS